MPRCRNDRKRRKRDCHVCNRRGADELDTQHGELLPEREALSIASYPGINVNVNVNVNVPVITQLNIAAFAGSQSNQAAGFHL